MKPRIPYTKPSITDKEIGYACDAAANGWGDHCYDYIKRFEAAFISHLGAKHAISTSSCTGALHMGLAAIGVGPGDEVILADTNWTATAAPIVHLGAKPVFVDVLADSWCIDPDKAEAAITSKTKAIIAAHIYGNLCDMDRLLKLGSQYNIPIVEDAAEALGSEWHGRKAGSIGEFGVFSFHGTKTLTTGEGGMFVTDNDELFEKVLTLSNHGRASSQKKQFWPDEIGFKYKMSNLQAAIGLGQIERVSELIERKREIFYTYRERLSDTIGVSLNPEPDKTRNGFWMPTVVCAPESRVTREKLQAAFSSENIDARVFFWPLSSVPAYRGKHTQNPVAYGLSERSINLPSYHDLRIDEIDRVVSVLRQLLGSVAA